RRSIIAAQGWSASDNPGSRGRERSTLKALGLCGNNPFRVRRTVIMFTQGCRLRSNPGLELANAFGVYRAGVPRILANACGVIAQGSAGSRPARAFGLRQHSASCRRSRLTMAPAL